MDISTSDNATVVRRHFEEVLGDGRLDLLEELVASDYVDRTARVGRLPGVAGIREVVQMFHSAFPDLSRHHPAAPFTRPCCANPADVALSPRAHRGLSEARWPWPSRQVLAR